MGGKTGRISQFVSCLKAMVTRRLVKGERKSTVAKIGMDEQSIGNKLPRCPDYAVSGSIFCLALVKRAFSSLPSEATGKVK